MSWFPLTPQKQKIEELTPFSVTDIESMKWTEFLTIGIYDGKNFTHFEDWDMYFDFIFSQNNTEYFAHFGGKFDFLFILKEVLPRKNIKIVSIIPRGSSILILKIQRKNKVISFHDSSALLPFALKTLTKNFDVENKKQEWDHSKTKGVTPELLDYLKDDCIGLHQVLTKFYTSKMVSGSKQAKTIASQAQKIMQLYIDKPIASLTNKDALARESYCGGRTEIFKPIFKKGKIYNYDVNSLYPYIMATHKMPGRKLYKTFEFKENSLGFWRCKVKAPENLYIPLLPKKIDGKLIYPLGNFEGVYSTNQINYARKLGYDIEITEGEVFEDLGLIFKNFILKLWKVRQNSEKNSVDNFIAKIIMNSSYGRFAISPEKEEIVIDDGGDGITPFRNYIETSDGTYRLGLKDKNLEIFSNCAIASQITGDASIYMHKLYLKCDLYYTDTDSIYTTTKLETSNELGGLKLEGVWDSAVFLLPKTYLTKSKTEKIVHMKGFDKKKIQGFDYEDFINCLNGEKTLKIDIEPKFASLKQAIKNKKVVTMTKASSKQIKSFYDKREIIKVKGKYDTKPLNLKEF